MVPKGEDLAFTAALHELPVPARDLLAVPVHSADMAKNQRLLVLKVLHERQTTVADNIILKGTALSNERETEEERKEDRERAVALRYQKQGGGVIKGGPPLCVVSYRLDSLWTFLQLPYLSNATAAELNGSWVTTWFTCAKAAHAQLGPEVRGDSGRPTDRAYGARALEARSHTVAEADERGLPGCGALALHTRLPRVP